MRVLVLHTSTHDPQQSSAAALGYRAVEALSRLAPTPVEIRFLDVAKLKIAENLSCYANGKRSCADPGSGPYRCWANVGDKADQMPQVYDGLAWADVVIVTTSVRWGSHTAVLQRMIERMNTLENRATSYGEPYPLLGKKLGVVVTGLHWRAAQVADRLLETLRWWGFATQPGSANALVWQRTQDVTFEHPDNDRPYVERWMDTPAAQREIERWAQAVLSSRTVAVPPPRRPAATPR